MRGIVLGTGPSVTDEVIQALSSTTLPIYGCNNAYQIAPLKALLACNIEWWDYYYPRDPALSESTFDKWTWDWNTAQKYGINFIQGKWADSLSTTKGVIHYGHSAGYQLLNLATVEYGLTEVILVGYDLKYPAGYDGRARNPGGKRHYFGEYPPELQHWTVNTGKNGELDGLLGCYRTIDTEKLGIRIINCSPDSALDCFETGNVADYV